MAQRDRILVNKDVTTKQNKDKEEDTKEDKLLGCVKYWLNHSRIFYAQLDDFVDNFIVDQLSLSGIPEKYLNRKPK